MDTVPASFRRRIKQFVDGYLGSKRMPVAFGGRATEINALNAWFNDPDSPSHLLVAAEAGRGKTALLVRWLEQLDDDVPLAFVPISIRYQTSRPAVFFQAFAARLAYLLGETLPTATSDPAEFYKEKLAEYLETLEDRGEPCLIVVDGLDEATGWQFDANFLPECTGSCLRVLVSARILAGDQDETGWLRRLEWDDPDASVTSMRIPPLNATGIADVLRQTDPQLAPFADDQDLVADLDRLTAGDPLLLTFYVDDLRQWITDGETGRPQLSDSDAGFGPYFERWLKKQGGIYQDTGTAFDEQIIKAILAILSCAIGPLPLRDLAALVERLTEERHLIAKDTMTPLERFIVGDGNDLGYALGHPKLRNYIRDEYFGGSDNVDRAEQVFVDWGREKIAELSDGGIDPRDMPHYLLQFHAQHLEVVHANIDAYQELMSPTWRAAWEADRQGEGYLGLSNDVDIATRAICDALGSAEATEQPTLWSDFFAGALISSSIQSLSSGIPPALLAKALEHDALAVGSALHFAERRESAARLAAIAAVAEALSETRRRTVLEEAFASISTFADETARGQAIADLAPHLPPDLLEDALRFAINIEYEPARQVALVGLIPALPPQDQDRAIAVAIAEMSSWRLFDLIAKISPHLYEDRLQKLIEIAKKGSNLQDRAKAFGNIAYALNAKDQQQIANEALHSVRVTDHSRINWGDVHRALAPLQPDIRGPVVVEITTLTKERYDEELDIGIERFTDPDFGYDHLQDFEADEVKARVVRDLAQHFRPAILKLADIAVAATAEIVFDLAKKALHPGHLFQCCALLAETSPPEARASYIDTAKAILEQGWDYQEEPEDPVTSLTTLARCSNGDDAAFFLQQAQIFASTERVEQAAASVKILPENARAPVIRTILQKLDETRYAQERQNAVAHLATHLDATTVHEVLRIATRVSTGDDLAPLMQALAGHLPPDATHLAAQTALTYSVENLVPCLTKIGPHLSEQTALQILEEIGSRRRIPIADSAEAALLTAVSPTQRDAFVQTKIDTWQKTQQPGFGVSIRSYLPILPEDLRWTLLTQILEEPWRHTEDLVANLLDEDFVAQTPNAKDLIRAYLAEVDVTNVQALCKKLRAVFDDLTPVIPDVWLGVRGFFDLPRHYMLGFITEESELLAQSRYFSERIRNAVLTERGDQWSDWQEWTQAMPLLPPEAATQHADYLCAYMRALTQPDDPDIPTPMSANALGLLSSGVATTAQFAGDYLSEGELMALLDYDVDGFDRGRIIKAVFIAATGPVLDRVLPLLPDDIFLDMSSPELERTLKCKTDDEVHHIFKLWRAAWPNVVKRSLPPFLPYLDDATIGQLVPQAHSTESLIALIDAASDTTHAALAEHAIDTLPEEVDLWTLQKLVMAAQGNKRSQTLKLYMRQLGDLSRQEVMGEIASISGNLVTDLPDSAAGVIYNRVSAVLAEWH